MRLPIASREIHNLADLLFDSAERYAGRDALHCQGHYEKLSYARLQEEVLKLALALQGFGLKAGDKGIILSENRPEWVITDFAALALGMVIVPIHSVLSPAQIGEIINETKPRIIFFSNAAMEAKLYQAEEAATIPYLISFDPVKKPRFTQVQSFQDVISRIKAAPGQFVEIIKSAREIQPDADASIIYTSGTTGNLKGVRLTHRNFVSNVLALLNHIDIYPEDKFFSVLPLSHVFERTAGNYVPLRAGASVAYCSNLTKLASEIKTARPTVVLAVPALFEKIYLKIVAKAKKKFVSNLVFHLGLRFGSRGLLSKVFDKLVFSRIRAEFGGEIRFFVAGGAPLPRSLGEFYQKTGLTILEGYGLTETSPVIAVNPLEANKFGTVGTALAGVRVRISAAGEIQVQGPNVMKGYLREEDNQAAFTEDGWFRTGDLGSLDDQGYLTITGREKELIVLATGKKVVPSLIEKKLESSPYIEQAMVVGEGQEQIGALIVPNFENIQRDTGLQEVGLIISDPKVRKLIAAEVERLTAGLALHERVRKFALLQEPFSLEKGELTPTLKLRRFVIYERYQKEIASIFG